MRLTQPAAGLAAKRGRRSISAREPGSHLLLLNSNSGAMSARRFSDLVGEPTCLRLLRLEWLGNAFKRLRVRDRAAFLIPHTRMVRVG